MALMNKQKKLEKLEAIYDKALRTLDKNLNVDKGLVYGACQAMQTVSREIQTLERVMRILAGDSETESNITISYELELPEEADTPEA